VSHYDLEDQLWAQLAGAAECPTHRRLANLTAWRLRAVAPRVAIGVAVAVAVLFAVVAIRALAPGDDTTTTSKPRVLDRIALGGSLSTAIPAFGDAWINDSSRGDLLRVDPANRTVLARIHIRDTSGSRIFGLGAADGSIWALLGGDNQNGWIGPLVRVDPKTSSIRQRISLGSLQGLRIVAVGLVADPHEHALWIPATDGAIRVDTRTGTVDRRALVPMNHYGEVSGMGPPSDPLAMIASDGSLLRLDSRTGALRATVPLPFGRGHVAPASGHSVLLWRPDGVIARFDTATGRTLWQRRFAGNLRAPTAADGHVWAVLWGPAKPAERLVALDPATGATVADLTLHDPGTQTIVATRGELWLATLAGNVIIVKP
jgi:outer membrane protein assembly factor BamB